MNDSNESHTANRTAPQKRINRESWVVTILGMIVFLLLLIFMPPMIVKIPPDVHSFDLAPQLKVTGIAIILIGTAAFFLGKYEAHFRVLGRLLDDRPAIRWALRAMIVAALIGIWFIFYHPHFWFP